MDQFELGGIGVLVFIDHDVFIFVTALPENIGMLVEKLEREQDQIVEIHRVAGPQSALIAGADMLGEGGGIGIGEDGGPFAAVAVTAQERQHGGGVGLLRLVGNMAEDFFYGAELVGLVVDDEISFVTQALDVLAQNPHAQRMKSAYQPTGRVFSGGAGLFCVPAQVGWC